MTLLIIILVIKIFILIGWTEHLNSSVKKSEEKINNQNKQITTIEPILTLLEHSDYGIEYLQNCFLLFNRIKGKTNSQSNKELKKLIEPRIQRIYMQDKKEKFKNLVQQLDWDILVNIELFLLFHGIKSEWNMEINGDGF